MSAGKLVFGMLKEVEIAFSASIIRAMEIHRFMTRQGELLPSVIAQGGMILVRVERDGEEGGLLDRLRQI